jgi:precorrin-6B methylase 1
MSTPANPTGPPSEQERQPSKVSPELVRAVAGRVYAMLLENLKIERERYRLRQARSLKDKCRR